MINEAQKYRFPVIETQIFPNVLFFGILYHFKGICFEVCENYQKRSFRNRYIIGTTQGKLNMSIPLQKGKNESQAIRLVNISYDFNWQQQQWNAIQSAYGKSPYFIYYKDEIQDLIFQKTNSLFEFNQKIIQMICSLIKLPCEFEYTTDFNPENSISFYNKINLQSNTGQAEYYQVFQKDRFIPNLSILDTLFRLGPETLLYVKSTKSLLDKLI